MPNRVEGRVTIRDADILPGSFRNFAGEQRKYNRAGKRTFYVRLPYDLAQAMLNDGWNVKEMKQREGDEEPEQRFMIEVELKYSTQPPHVTLISSGGRTVLSESMIGMLDAVSIGKADVVLNPYNWDVDGNQGVKAYLKTAFITIDEDELEAEYGFGQLPGEPSDDNFNE